MAREFRHFARASRRVEDPEGNVVQVRHGKRKCRAYPRHGRIAGRTVECLIDERRIVLRFENVVLIDAGAVAIAVRAGDQIRCIGLVVERLPVGAISGRIGRQRTRSGNRGNQCEGKGPQTYHASSPNDETRQQGRCG